MHLTNKILRDPQLCRAPQLCQAQTLSSGETPSSAKHMSSALPSSQLCQAQLLSSARVNPLPSFLQADEDLSAYKRDVVGPVPMSFGVGLKSTLERYRVLQRFLLVLALLGACMVIGDGILSPAISVFSAVSGVEVAMAKEHHKCRK